MSRAPKNGRSFWKDHELDLLKNVFSKEEPPYSWNSVALQLYEQSNGRCFKSGAACREVWNNHLNPSLVKSEWTPEEDSQLLQGVWELGKKWSQISKRFGDSRTEHMVKNRFFVMSKQLVPKHLQVAEEKALNYLLQMNKEVMAATSTIPDKEVVIWQEAKDRKGSEFGLLKSEESPVVIEGRGR